MEYGKLLIDRAAEKTGEILAAGASLAVCQNRALLIIKKLALQWVKLRFKKIFPAEFLPCAEKKTIGRCLRPEPSWLRHQA